MSGVAAALEKNAGVGESKGVKAHFSMDDSGILGINLVEAVFEKNTTDTETGDGGVGDTLSKLGSAFSKLFSGSTEGEGADKAGPGGEESAEGNVANATAEDGGSQQEQQSDSSSQQGQNTTQQPGVNGTEQTAGGDAAASNATTSEGTKKVKTVLVKEPLDVTVNVLDIPQLTEERFQYTSAK